jgi:hypothetical protein
MIAYIITDKATACTFASMEDLISWSKDHPETCIEVDGDRDHYFLAGLKREYGAKSA